MLLQHCGVTPVTFPFRLLVVVQTSAPCSNTLATAAVKIDDLNDLLISSPALGVACHVCAGLSPRANAVASNDNDKCHCRPSRGFYSK